MVTKEWKWTFKLKELGVRWPVTYKTVLEVIQEGVRGGVDGQTNALAALGALVLIFAVCLYPLIRLKCFYQLFTTAAIGKRDNDSILQYKA